MLLPLSTGLRFSLYRSIIKNHISFLTETGLYASNMISILSDSDDDHATAVSETTTPSSNSTHSDNTTTEATTTITTAAANITGKNDLVPKFITNEVKKNEKGSFFCMFRSEKGQPRGGKNIFLSRDRKNQVKKF